MKNIFKTLVVAAALVAAVSSVRAEEERLSVSVTADAVSKYVWRGQALSEASLQPGVSASAFGVTAGYWGSMNLTNVGGEQDELTENDFFASYGKDFGDAGSLEVGYIYYYFQGEETAETSEVYVSYGISAGLDFGVALYYDIDSVEDFYVNISAGKEFALEGGWTASAGASIGYGGADYNQAYFDDEDGVDEDAGLNDFNLSVGVGGPITGSLSSSFSLNYTDIIDQDLAADADNFWFTAGLEYSF